MRINEKNKYLVCYRLSCQIESQMPTPNDDEVERQRVLTAQGFLEPMKDYPDRYKLSAEGSKELLDIFDGYRKNIRKLLIDNRNVLKRSKLKIELSQLVKDLELTGLEIDLAEEWVDFFIVRLFREGFFAWWQPQYNEDMSEIHYYRYCENDEDSFIAERESLLNKREGK